MTIQRDNYDKALRATEETLKQPTLPCNRFQPSAPAMVKATLIGQRCDRNVSPYVGSYAISLIVINTERQVGKKGRNSGRSRPEEAHGGAV